MKTLRSSTRCSAILFVLLLALSSSLAAEEPATLRADQAEFFETRIRPVLAEHCYACHNSAGQAEGGLVLDHRQAMQAGGEGGPVVVAGDPMGSRLIAVVKHQIAGLEMPEDGAKLSDSVIADFEAWIAMGARDPRDEPPTSQQLASSGSWPSTLRERMQWWSFQPIVDPPVPGREGHPIDRFVRDRLAEQQLSPSPPATPAVLIRRLYLTLIGLPPTLEELSRWSERYQHANESTTAEVDAEVDTEVNAEFNAEVTEDLIDHLLASERFGERWARHWMDWVRYAESHGSEGDPPIDQAWQYRDYLIRALNQDVPFDQLLREHVAGDLLESPRINDAMGINESMIGTAHWRMVFHGYAPTDALEEKIRFVDDQINAFSKAFLGLTISCARCHDHKFDAVSQRDYYALFGVLASCRPSRSVIDLPARQRQHSEKLLELKQRVRVALADAWTESIPNLPEKLLTVDIEPSGSVGPQSPAYPLAQLRHRGTEEFAQSWQTLADDLSSQLERDDRAAGSDATLDRWRFSDASDVAKWTRSGWGLSAQPAAAGQFAIAPSGDLILTGIYPSGVYSHLLSNKHAALFTSPDVGLNSESEVWLRVIGDGDARTRYVVQDFPRDGTVYPAATLKPTWFWQRFDLSYWTGDSVHFEIASSKDAPLLVSGPERSWFGVTEVRRIKKGAAPPIARPEYFTALADAARQHGDPDNITSLARIYQSAIEQAVGAWRSGAASDAQAELLAYFTSSGLLPNSMSGLPHVAPLIEEYRSVEAQIPTPTRIPSLEETSGRTQALLVRGNHRSPAELVPRRFLEAIDDRPYSGIDSGRRELAEDLLRADNPLTRRVIVNRLWHHLFGRGIAATPDNFGRLGEAPTHPDLLDWLACRLVEDGGSLKSMIRRIVTSQTWQQSSVPSVESLRGDPGNLYLSHANLRRLEAEAIRDSLLFVTGSLRNEMYGSPVDGSEPRRSVYVRVMRNSLDPMLRVFDFPEPFSATGRRDVTNVPAQSLTLLNDPLVTKWASQLASSLLEASNSDKLTASDAGITDLQRLDELFLRLFSRRPESIERARAVQFITDTRRDLINTEATSDRTTAQDERQVEVEVWTEVTRALLLSKEFLYVP